MVPLPKFEQGLSLHFVGYENCYDSMRVNYVFLVGSSNGCSNFIDIFANTELDLIYSFCLSHVPIHCVP